MSVLPFQHTNKGYDTNATRLKDPPRPNGYLSFNGEICWLWVQELRTGFAMAGQRAQSYRTRTYFPHNFVQPSFTVNCQCANQEIYARTAEFIRHSQVSFSSSVHLWVVNMSKVRGTKLKGRHHSNVAEGYIKTVRREHRKFVYAPDLEFEFVVERHLQPSGWRDEDTSIKVLPTWREVIQQGKGGIALDPDIDPPKQDDPPVPPPRRGPLPSP